MCPTSFPNPNALGATLNKSLWHSMGSIIGTELRSLWLQGVTEASAWSGRPHAGLDCWSPNVNINRDPRWGRNQEVRTRPRGCACMHTQAHPQMYMYMCT